MEFNTEKHLRSGPNSMGTLLGWFVIHGITLLERGCPEHQQATKTGESGHDVRLLLNGIELDVEKIFEELEGQMEEMILDKALELTRELFADKGILIEDDLDAIHRGLRGLITKHNFEPPEDCEEPEDKKPEADLRPHFRPET